jgi:hypothetical protein
MNTLPIQLTIEQKFSLRIYTEAVKDMPDEDVRSYLLELIAQLMVKDNVIKHLIKEQLIGGEVGPM